MNWGISIILSAIFVAGLVTESVFPRFISPNFIEITLISISTLGCVGVMTNLVVSHYMESRRLLNEVNKENPNINKKSPKEIATLLDLSLKTKGLDYSRVLLSMIDKAMIGNVIKCQATKLFDLVASKAFKAEVGKEDSIQKNYTRLFLELLRLSPEISAKDLSETSREFIKKNIIERAIEDFTDKKYSCPIGFCIMKEPVIVGRHLFERELIELSLAVSSSHPLTREPLSQEDIKECSPEIKQDLKFFVDTVLHSPQLLRQIYSADGEEEKLLIQKFSDKMFDIIQDEVFENKAKEIEESIKNFLSEIGVKSRESSNTTATYLTGASAAQLNSSENAIAPAVL